MRSDLHWNKPLASVTLSLYMLELDWGLHSTGSSSAIIPQIGIRVEPPVAAGGQSGCTAQSILHIGTCKCWWKWINNHVY